MMKMTKYIALLRGINVGGNNKIAMPELKIGFESCGFSDVLTYINSGNILFNSHSTDETQLKDVCEAMITGHFGLNITVNIFAAEKLMDALSHSPDWWNTNPNEKHNAIFVIPPMTAEEICVQVGEIKPEYEKVSFHGQVIFWSAPLETFSRTRWSRIVDNKAAYSHITIRNANTTLKLMELAKK